VVGNRGGAPVSGLTVRLTFVDSQATVTSFQIGAIAPGELATPVELGPFNHSGQLEIALEPASSPDADCVSSNDVVMVNVAVALCP